MNTNECSDPLLAELGLRYGEPTDWADVFLTLAESADTTLPASPRMLIRPDARRYSNRPDYLMRLAQQNGLKGVLQLARALGTTLGVLGRLSGEDLNDLIRGEPITLIVERQSEEWRRAKYKGEPYKREARICPACIAEGEPMSPHFNLALPVSCSSHGTLVLDRCPRCGRSLTYLRLSVERCICGYWLQDASALAPPPWLRDLYAIFAPWHVGQLAHMDSNTLYERDRRAGQLIRILLTPARHLAGRRLKVGARITLNDFPALEGLFSNWGVVFDAALRAHLERLNPQSRTHLLRRFLTHGGTALTVAVARAAKSCLHPTSASTVTFRPHLTTEASTKLTTARENPPESFCNLRAAAGLLGCSEGTVRRLVSRGHIRALRVTNSVRSALFDNGSLKQWLFSLWENASRDLNIDRRPLPLAEIPCNDRKGRVLQSWVTLMDEVIAGRVRLYRTGAVASLAAIYIDEAVYASFRRRRPSRSKPSLSGAA